MIKYIYYIIAYIMYLVFLFIESFLYTLGLWAIMTRIHLNLLSFPQLTLFVFICGILFNIRDLVYLADDIDENFNDI